MLCLYIFISKTKTFKLYTCNVRCIPNMSLKYHGMWHKNKVQTKMGPANDKMLSEWKEMRQAGRRSFEFVPLIYKLTRKVFILTVYNLAKRKSWEKKRPHSFRSFQSEWLCMLGPSFSLFLAVFWYRKLRPLLCERRLSDGLCQKTKKIHIDRFFCENFVMCRN